MLAIVCFSRRHKCFDDSEVNKEVTVLLNRSHLDKHVRPVYRSDVDIFMYQTLWIRYLLHDHEIDPGMKWFLPQLIELVFLGTSTYFIVVAGAVVIVGIVMYYLVMVETYEFCKFVYNNKTMVKQTVRLAKTCFMCINKK